MKIVVLGGTAYVGPRLVRRLSRDNSVTVASRSRPRSCEGVGWVPIDRADASAMTALGRSAHWDVVYDQLCYDQEDARIACEAFRGRIGRYVMASSQAVYPAGFGLVESDFDALSHPLEGPTDPRLAYGIGKRRAEAYLTRFADFPFVAVRLPPILGVEDPRERLLGPMHAARRSGCLIVENASARTSLTHADEAAAFLSWLARAPVNGAVNLASRGWLSMIDIADMIGAAVGREVSVKERPSGNSDPYAVHTGWEQDPELFPLSVSNDWVQSARMAESLEFPVGCLRQWFPELLHETAKLPRGI